MKKQTASFRRAERLVQSSEIKDVLEKGRFFKTSGIKIFCLVSDSKENPKLGVVVSKKSVRDANKRNRFKRIAREFFRLHKQELPAGLKIVVRTMLDYNYLSNNELREAFKQLFYEIRTRFRTSR